MSGRDLFDLYRLMLALVVGTYVLIRAANVLARFLSSGDSGRRRDSIMVRYVLVQLLRTPIHRFSWDLLQIGGLGVLLVYLLRLHLGPASV